MSFANALQRAVWSMRLLGEFRATNFHRAHVQQAQRLKRLLRRAVRLSPFYRNRYRGIDIEECNLSHLPTTTKAELMANFDDVVTDRRVRRRDLESFVDDPANIGRLFLNEYFVCHTSGSQGQPMLVVQDALGLDVLFACQMIRGNVNFARAGVWEAARRVVKPARLAILISRPGFFPSAWVWKHLPAAMQMYVRLLYLQASDPELIEKLNDFQPTILISTPTTLDLLALKRDRLRLNNLIQVAPNSETLSDATRNRLAAAFGVPVVETYGAGECLFLTNGCHTHPGTHVNADWAILEVVDSANRPVAAGQLGDKVLVTNLANIAQPLIRYEIADRVTMATEPCACGNPLPRIARVLGRTADFFWVRSGATYRVLSPYPFQHALEYFRELREWRATQLERNRIRVEFEPLPGAALDLNNIEARLAERLAFAGFANQLQLEFAIVPRLAADPVTGKIRRIVSLVGAPSDLDQPSPGNPMRNGVAAELNCVNSPSVMQS